MPLVTAVQGQHRRSDRNGWHAVWRQHMLLPPARNLREREQAQACSHRLDGAIKVRSTCPPRGSSRCPYIEVPGLVSGWVELQPICVTARRDSGTPIVSTWRLRPSMGLSDRVP